MAGEAQATERVGSEPGQGAVGALAAGVAHDFNNILSIILTYVVLIMDDLEPDDPMRSDLEEVHDAAERAVQLTRQLSGLGMQQLLEPRVLDLNQIALDMEPTLRRLISEDIEIVLVASLLPARIIADRAHVQQAIMNLVVTASASMPRSATLTIETAHVDLDADSAGALELAPGSYATLGVWTMPGQDTASRVYFPRTDRPLDFVSASAPQASLDGTETILLVEDDERVRLAVGTALRRRGYQVLEAEDGRVALRVCDEFQGPIDLLLTDVVMPRMNGRELADQLAPHRPEMRVVFTSGHSEDAVVHHGVLQANVAFLAKPIVPAALLRKVREVLDAVTPRRGGSEGARKTPPA